MTAKIMVPVELTPRMQQIFYNVARIDPRAAQFMWEALCLAGMTHNAQENSDGLLKSSGSETTS